MKKFLALLLACVMVLSLFAGCGSNGDDETTGGSNETTGNVGGNENEGTVNTEYRVAMITDYGDITDQSFNQSTYEACVAYCDANNIDFTYKKPVGDSTAERVAMVETAIVEGYNIIVMPGYAFAGTIVEVCEMYPDVIFFALDVSLGDILAEAVGADYDYNPDNWNVEDYIDLSNVYCAIYQEELSGYMAGYAAVKLGYRHLGFLGGMAVPAVQRFGYGFMQGVDAAAAELNVADEVVLEYIYGGVFTGDADITAVMDTWYAELGVEVVFACGGGIYNSAAEAAAKVGGKVIGVDSDQAPIIDGTYGEGMTVTSAMKGLAPTVTDTLTDIINNGNWSAYAGKIISLGMVSGTDPELNYVQIPMDNTQWSDGFSAEDYKALVAAMFDGTVTVSSAIDAMPEVAYTVNEYANIK